MECGTCGGGGKRRRPRFIVNKTGQIGVGMTTTNNIGREGEGDEYK